MFLIKFIQLVLHLPSAQKSIGFLNAWIQRSPFVDYTGGKSKVFQGCKEFAGAQNLKGRAFRLLGLVCLKYDSRNSKMTDFLSQRRGLTVLLII